MHTLVVDARAFALLAWGRSWQSQGLHPPQCSRQQMARV